jgi:hypothetical protein
MPRSSPMILSFITHTIAMKHTPIFHHSNTPPLRAWLLAALVLSSFILHPLSFAAESPTYIPFQGQVTNQTGTIVADGQYSIIFNLYDQAVGGQPVWSERHVKVGVTRGMVNVFLGSIAAFDRGTPITTDDVDFSQTKYLGITVDTDNLATTADPEMVPRSLIIPSFFSKNTSKMLGYDWSSLFQDGSSQPTNNIAGGSLKPSLFGNNSIDASKLINGSVGFPSLSADVISSLGGSLTQGSLVPSMTALEAIADRNAVAITKDAGDNTRLFKANSSVGSRSAFYGFAKGAAAINAPVTIHQFGALDGFTGLTAGSSYYLGTTDGAITASYPAGNPIYVGYALTGTTLFVDPFGVTKKWANQNFWGNASDGAVSTTGDVNLASTLDGDVVVKQYSSLTINAGHTMTVANRCRGLVIYVDGSCTINGTLTMTARGANVDPTLPNSIPATGIRLVRRKTGATETLLTGSDLGGTGAGGVGNDWRTYEGLQPPINNDGKIYTILRAGGGGGGGIGYQNSGIPGQSVANGMGGGGGGGSANSGGGSSGGGSAGTCYSGGSGGGGNWGNGNVGNAGNASANGGAGGNGAGNSPFGGSGGAGNPPGTTPNGATAEAGTGGLLLLFVRGNLTIGSTGKIASNGSSGAYVYAGSGGGSGGGRIIVLYAGSLTNTGAIQSNGGAAGGVQTGIPGGSGGNGDYTIEQIAP